MRNGGKRGNGEGSISKRKDGRWHARITTGWNNGRQIRENIYGKTRREVHDKLSQAQQSLKGGTYSAGKVPTLEKFLTHWLDHVKVGPTTRPAYRQKLTLHVIPTLGHIRVDRLTVQDVNHLARRESKATIRSVGRAHSGRPQGRP
jgi:integrase